MLEVTSIVNKLESKYHIDLDTLKSDENFISLLLRASGVAIKTHQKERVNALRNLLLNSVVDRDTTEDQKHLFLSLVDEQTISHFKILSLSQGGICWMPINGQDDKRGFGVWVELAKVLCREFDEFSEKEDFIYQIITDLQNKQLLRSVRIPIEYRTAKFGEEVAVSTDWGKEESLIPSYFFCRKDGMRYLTIPTDLGREFLRFILNDEM
jgi:hypothetical protein